jgi:hypothetical protein
VESIREVIEQLVRKLKDTINRRFSEKNSGVLDIKKTLHRAAGYQGIPVELFFRNRLSLANIPSLLKLLTFSHRPAKSASMMKMLLKLILNILLRPQKDSDLVLENLALRQQLAAMKESGKNRGGSCGPNRTSGF